MKQWHFSNSKGTLKKKKKNKEEEVTFFFFFEKNPLKGRDHIIAFSINQVGTPQECLVEQTPSRPKMGNWQLA